METMMTQEQLAEMIESENVSETSSAISGNIPADEGISQLARLISAYDEKKELADSLENQLKNLNADILRLTDDLIPSKMQELGVKTFTLSDGKKITVKEMVFANIAKDRQEEAFNWLIENNFGDVLKKELTFIIDKDAKLDPTDAYMMLREHFKGITGYDLKKSIHPATLKALVNEQVKEGNSKFQSDGVKKLLGIYEVDRAVIGKSK